MAAAKKGPNQNQAGIDPVDSQQDQGQSLPQSGGGRTDKSDRCRPNWTW